MPTLTDLTNAIVKSSATKLYGTVLTRPAILVTDGKNVTYACDVQIGQYDVTGQINQTSTDLLGVPGSSSWTLAQLLTVGSILRNVPIARNNYELIYADVGNAVELTRDASGQWTVTGFALEQPGTFTLVEVDLGNMTIGPITDLSIQGRVLTLGELGTLIAGGWGLVPFGASGLFVGGVLQQITGMTGIVP